MVYCRRADLFAAVGLLPMLPQQVQILPWGGNHAACLTLQTIYVMQSTETCNKPRLDPPPRCYLERAAHNSVMAG